MNAHKVPEAFAVGICLALAAAVVAIQGCSTAHGINDAIWGQAAVITTDSNGRVTVVTPATVGIAKPVTEGLAALLAALGLPILAIWIRGVSKTAQEAREQALRAAGSKEMPP